MFIEQKEGGKTKTQTGFRQKQQTKTNQKKKSQNSKNTSHPSTAKVQLLTLHYMTVTDSNVDRVEDGKVHRKEQRMQGIQKQKLSQSQGGKGKTGK